MLKSSFAAVFACILAGCAASSAVSAPPAHQAAEAPQPPPRIVLSTLPGWTPLHVDQPRGEASVAFRHDGAKAALTARTVHADGADVRDVLGGVGRMVAENMRLACVSRDAEANYASARCSGDVDGVPVRALLAVRRPKDRPEVLLVMSAIWPAALPPSFGEEVDLMFLLATAE